MVDDIYELEEMERESVHRAVAEPCFYCGEGTDNILVEKVNYVRKEGACTAYVDWYCENCESEFFTSHLLVLKDGEFYFPEDLEE